MRPLHLERWDFASWTPASAMARIIMPRHGQRSALSTELGR
jgi:hypothetical protein